MNITNPNCWIYNLSSKSRKENKHKSHCQQIEKTRKTMPLQMFRPASLRAKRTGTTLSWLNSKLHDEKCESTFKWWKSPHLSDGHQNRLPSPKEKRTSESNSVIWNRNSIPHPKPDSRISTLQPRENRTHSRQERRKGDERERERERERDSLFGIHLARSRPPQTGSVFWSSTPLTTDHDLEDHRTPSKFCSSFSSPPAEHGWWCAGFWNGKEYRTQEAETAVNGNTKRKRKERQRRAEDKERSESDGARKRGFATTNVA